MLEVAHRNNILLHKAVDDTVSPWKKESSSITWTKWCGQDNLIRMITGIFIYEGTIGSKEKF
jgi:hypothetical protein